MSSEQQLASEESVESRWEAAPAVLAVILLQFALAMVSFDRHWTLSKLPWWVWLIAVVPETTLLVSLASDSGREALERIGHRRNAALTLLGVITL